MNDNKKLIKNFPNCFQVSWMERRLPSLGPTLKSGGPTGLALAGKGPGSPSAQRSSDSGEPMRVQPRGAAAGPPAAAARGQPLSPARLRTWGRWGWRVPFQTAGGADWVRLCSQDDGDPPSLRRCRVLSLPRGTPTHSGPSTQGIPDPKSSSLGRATAVCSVCAPSPPSPRDARPGGGFSLPQAAAPHRWRDGHRRAGSGRDLTRPRRT